MQCFYELLKNQTTNYIFDLYVVCFIVFLINSTLLSQGSMARNVAVVVFIFHMRYIKILSIYEWKFKQNFKITKITKGHHPNTARTKNLSFLILPPFALLNIQETLYQILLLNDLYYYLLEYLNPSLLILYLIVLY